MVGHVHHDSKDGYKKTEEAGGHALSQLKVCSPSTAQEPNEIFAECSWASGVNKIIEIRSIC